jgi:ABC-type lipoprotein release transport system permease subunit
LARVIESLLYGVPPLDPVSFVVAASGLAALCLAASALPAVRASRLQPMDVLRSE